MRTVKITSLLLVVAVALAGTTAAVGSENARARRGLKALGLKVYWSLLDEEQKEQAKEIAADYQAESAPDRLGALGRLVRYKGDVAKVLTKEQRVEAGQVKAVWKRLSEDKKKKYVQRLLTETDRKALAEKMERCIGAGPETKVDVGFEVFDQLFDLMEPKLAKRLTLTETQRQEIRELYDELKIDLRPVAIRIETAKQLAARKGIAILDEDQKARLEKFKTSVIEKVLEFING